MSELKEYTIEQIVVDYFDYRGKTPKKLGMNWGGGTIKALSANNVEKGKINFDKECYLASEQLYKIWMNKGDCEKGDVLMTMEAPLGNIAQIPDDKKYILSQRTLLFKTRKEIVNNDYLFYVLSDKAFQDELIKNSTGSTVVGIQQKKLARLKINLPSLTFQKHISTILRTADAIIEKTQSAIDKYKAIKQGMLQDLFTRGIDITTGKLRPRYEEAPELYKESKLGWIPNEWNIVRLDYYFSLLKSGLSRLLSEQDIGIPVLISGNIQENKIDFSSLRYWYENDPQGADTKSYELTIGDILLCFINSIDQIGKVAIYEGYYRPCIYTTNLFRIKVSLNASSHFLYRLLSSEIVQNEIKAILKPAVNQASFTTKDFCKIPVPNIPAVEQQFLNKHLEQIEKTLQKELVNLHKLKMLKSGLMSDLLSGRKRVNVDDEDLSKTIS